MTPTEQVLYNGLKSIQRIIENEQLSPLRVVTLIDLAVVKTFIEYDKATSLLNQNKNETIQTSD